MVSLYDNICSSSLAMEDLPLSGEHDYIMHYRSELLFILLIILFFFFWYLRRRKKETLQKTEKNAVHVLSSNKYCL